MGAFCCKSDYHVEEDHALDVSRHFVLGSGGFSRSSHRKVDGIVPVKSDIGETQELVDAFQSFSELNHYASDAKTQTQKYTYPPTKTMQIRGSTLCIEMAPRDLLRSNSIHNSNSLANTNATTTLQSSEHQQQRQHEDGQNEVPLSESTTELQECLGHTTNVGVTAAARVVTHGYPGTLNEDELEACLRFRDELQTRDNPAYREMVRAYAPAESEAFALCRFLRARDFDVDAVFAMLEENNNACCEVWNEAKANNFYRDYFETEYGCPFPVLLALFPALVSGIAKNGATVLYFKPGNTDINGLECVCNVTIDLLPMFWDLLHHKGTNSMLREQARCHDPTNTTVLAERIVLLDLGGNDIPPALFDRELFGLCRKIANCFPETMNRTYVVNVPMSFKVVWAVAKLFLNERTLSKIGFFSCANTDKATEDLLQLVDANELLSTYGGEGPSFEEVLAKKQAKYGTESNSRYLTKTLTIYTSYETKMTVPLTRGEKVASIRIYSKGDCGAEFWVTSEDGRGIGGSSILVESTIVQRPSEGSIEEPRTPKAARNYSANLDVAKIPSGVDQTLAVSAKGCGAAAAKEFYLVTIHICSCC